MIFKQIKDDYIVRLNEGELLVKNLLDLVNQNEVKGAWISGLGAAKWAEIGFYDLPNKKYEWSKINRPLEILSLQGNIAWVNNELIIHIHGSFSDDKMQTLGGHVKELEVGGTCEIIINTLNSSELLRLRDDDTGLNLLNLEN